MVCALLAEWEYIMNRFILVALAMISIVTPTLGQQAEAPLNVAEWSSARDILVGARAQINVGWGQGETINPDGMPRISCLATALEASLLEKRKSIVDFNYAMLALNKAIDAPAALPTSESDPLPVPYWGRYLMYWNDAPGRTKEEVIAALDTAISYSEQQRILAVDEKKTGLDVLNYDKSVMTQLGFTKQ
jgi:hypothetical protein